ncbi:hypothetical protein KDK_38580 [Dictyobacter kobayashii]|uniref:Probable membrane transporter protein n=2 Tax=Dictyobacter kobayashii TaxID=2014872 RepID=A0A402ALI4_9CHLR|nr:hypothetical protein KDK_38580 [Dictyobacter kobayashii]
MKRLTSSDKSTAQTQAQKQPPPSKLSNSISWILQGGVILSALLIVIGIALLPTRPGGLTPERVLNFPQTLTQVGAGLLILRPQAFIMLGLLLLIATPIVRVAASLVTFVIERDYKYVVITGTVLVILIFSLFLGSRSQENEVAINTFQIHFSLGVALMIFVGSLLAGVIGALVGLGGGIMVVPMLTIIFGFPIPFAIGVSIISVIATSSGAAVAYLRDHLTNIRIGMFLEIGTTLGAISGAFVAGLLAPNLLGVIFGIILIVSAAPLIFKIGEELPQNVSNDSWARTLNLASSYPDHKLGREVPYQVTRTPFGLAMMYIAGLISGLLGIGSGTFKVIAMDTIMRLPLKVSTTTSNLMIGVTAAASAGIYFSRGNIPPLIAAPVALGVLAGALLGARLLLHMSNKILRIIFVPVIIIAALEMILHGLGIGSF